MRKYLPYILILIISVGLFGPIVEARAATSTTEYKLLAPLPDPDNNNKLKNEVDPASGLGSYLNMMIKIFIGLCAVLSVVMIVVGGIEVMTSELAHTKQAGKERILQAVLGLLIALGAYALLYTINPDLLKSDFCIPPQTFMNGKCVDRPSAAPAAITPAAITPFQTPNTGSNTNNIAPYTAP